MNVLVKTQKIQVLLRGRALGRGKVHQALVMGYSVCFGGVIWL